MDDSGPSLTKLQPIGVEEMLHAQPHDQFCRYIRRKFKEKGNRDSRLTMMVFLSPRGTMEFKSLFPIRWIIESFTSSIIHFLSATRVVEKFTIESDGICNVQPYQSTAIPLQGGSHTAGETWSNSGILSRSCNCFSLRRRYHPCVF